MGVSQMKNKPLISIIMPVYNTPEDFFIPSVKSILNQTYENIEFIIVDDGSTTNIKSIVETFDDERIIYINEGHHGAGEARNIGIKASNGEYIYIIGSDDTLENNALEFCMNLMQKHSADIVSFNICGQNNSGNIVVCNSPVPFNITKPGDATQIVKKSLIEENKIKYENLTSCNDVTFTFTAIALAKKVVKINKTFYHYNMNVPGQISSNRGKKAMNIFLAFDALKRNLKNKNMFDVYKNIFNRQFADCVEYEIKNIHDKDYKENFLSTLKEKYKPIYDLVFPNNNNNTKIKRTQKHKFF